MAAAELTCCRQNEPGLGEFNITLFDDAGGTGDATGQMTYDMFNMPLSNSWRVRSIPRRGKIGARFRQFHGSAWAIATQTGITGTS